MITCRICGEKAAVVEARGNGAEWIRIRQCKCGHRFYTCEQEIDPHDGDALFKAHQREHYDRCRKRRDDCHLVDLGEHGDLIDRDKLLRDIEYYHLSDGKFQHWVEVQQAVIEAEEEA